MKSLREIGFKKTFLFIAYSFLQLVYQILLFPQFRKLFLILLGAKVGKDSILMDIRFFNWYHKGPKGIRIGKECFIGDGTLIDLYDEVIFEAQVTLAQRVLILTHLNVGYSDHPLQKHFPKMSKPVIFKSGCVVGAASTILPGVIIGRESFVAAGSVVTKDVPDRTLVAGSPAKVIRKI